MLIGADRLFSLINVDEIEKALPSSPKANGEGHGRFESLLYNSSAPQDGLMAMASKEGRLKLPSFAAPVGEEGGTLVASKAESDVDDSPNPEGEIDLKVEDIASSQLDDLLSSLLGPLAHGDLDAERDQVITPPGDEPLTDVVTDLEKPSLPVIPLDRPVSEVAPKAESESLSAPAKPTEIPDTPVKPETGRNTVPEQDVVAKVEVASPAKPEGIKATADPKVQVDQAAALDVEVASPAKPEGIQATAEPKVQVGQAATPDVEVVSPAKPEGTPTVPGQRAQIEPTRPEGAQPDLPSSDGTIKADTVKPELPTSVMTDLEKPSLPVIPLDRPVSEVAPKAEPESPLAPAQREEIPDTPVKPETGRNTVPEQDVVAKVKVTSPAKPEGIQATAEPKVQIGQAATPDVELASPAKPEGIQATAEPKAQIGQVATPDVELASSAKPEGTPTVPGQRAQVEPTRPEATQPDLPSSDGTIKADTVKPGPPASVMTDLEKPSPPVIPLDRPVSEVAPKAESESPLAPAQREEIPDTPVKPETGRNTVPEQDVVAKVEVASPAKPEGIKATADPKVQVDQAAALDVEVASPAKSEVIPTVPEQRAQVEPTRAEVAQPDLPSSDATIKADTVKLEPPTGVMTDLEKPSLPVIPLDRPVSEVAPKAESESLSAPAQREEIPDKPVKPETGRNTVPEQDVVAKVEVTSPAKPEGIQATADPKVQVSQAATPDVEVVSPAKPEVIPNVPEQRAQVEPTRPEATQLDLPSSDATIKADTVKPEPPASVMTDLEKPSLPVIPLDRPVSEVAPKAESESLSAPAQREEIPDKPVKPETGRNTVPEQDVVAKVEVASPAKPEGIQTTAEPKVQVGQAATPDVEVVSPAKPEGIQTTAEPKVQVGQAAAPDVEVVSPAKPEGIQATAEPKVQVDQAAALDVEVVSPAKPEVIPTVPEQRAQIEPTRPEVTQPDLPSSDATIKADTVKPEPPTGVMTDLEKPSLPVIPLDRPVSEVAPKAESESLSIPAQREEIPDKPVKPETGRNTVPEQDVVAKVEVASPAKPEGIKATADPKVQVDQAAAPDVEVVSPAKPEGIQATAEPKVQVGQAAAPDVEVVSPAKPEGIQATADPKVQVDQAAAPDVEVVSPAKPEGIQATADPKVQVDQAAALDVEVASPAKPEVIPTVPEQRAQVEPTRPEATQPDLPSSDATIKADTVKPEPPASVMTDLEKPSPRGSSGPGSMVQKDQPRSEPSVHMTQVATLVAQESAAHTVKIVAPRTVQSRGYLISPETTSSNVEEGRIDAQSWSKGKEIPMFLSSWTPEKREEKFQPVAEISENKPEDSFQRVVDQGLENLVVQTDTRQSVQPKSEPLPTQTVYLPQKGPDALPHGLVQVVRHVMADGTQKATVIIDPPALGRVEVEVRATSTGIEASFKVDSAQVRDMIKPQIPVLQDMLSQQGIVASSISVDIRQGDERRSPWRDSLDSIKLRRRKGATEEEELEISSMDIARLDMERGVLQWYA